MSTLINSPTGEPYVAVDVNGKKELVIVNGDYLALDPTPFKGDKGDKGERGIDGAKGQDGAGITPAIKAKLDNMPDDTNASLHQLTLEVQELDGKKVSGNRILSDLPSGPTAGKESTLATEKYADDEHTALEGRLTTNINANTEDIIELQANQTLVEKVWSGTELINGTTIDASGLLDQEGKPFDFTAGRKIEFDFGLKGTSSDHDAHVIVSGVKETFHIQGPAKAIDVSFQASVDTNGLITISSFNNHGSTVKTIADVKLKEMFEARPVAKADLSAYAKKTELTNKADIDLSNSTGIQFYKGQMLEFNEIKTGTKFEDTTLFTKHLIQEGQAIVGGTDGSETTGQAGELPIPKNLKLQGRVGRPDTGDKGYNAFTDIDLDNGAGKNWGVGSGGDGGWVSAQLSLSGDKISKDKPTLAAGIKLLKVVYVAKKDITYGDMK